MPIQRLATQAQSLVCGILCWMCLNASAQNIIQRENLKQGTADWQITNLKTDFEWRTQNPLSDPYPEIEGYASLTSVSRGGTIKFYVNTREPSFSLAVYRVGWYGGVGGRQVWPAGGGSVTLPGLKQDIPVAQNSEGLVECNWVESYSLTVPNSDDKTDWASGMYLVKLTAATSGKQSYIPFVVRDNTSSSTYLFQSSVTTSQAYNPWGGKSVYAFNSSNGPARKVSFNRPYAREHTQPSNYPYITHGTRFGAGLFFQWEINLLRFMEREGYDVSYVTNLDLHENPNIIYSHKAFLSVGHDEYWTYQMKSAVHAAQSNGIHLGFFAANEAYWQIRLEPSAAGQPNRTITAYKEAAGSADPYATDRDKTNDKYITARFRDLKPMFRVVDSIAQPENGLIGVMYHGDPADGPIVVSDPSHWIYAGIGVSAGTSLPGLMGYETNAMADNGFTPLGISKVADSPDPWGGSHATVFTSPSGAVTFATGSMQWNWGLDGYGNPCGNRCVNPTAQQVTRNILARFAQSSLAAPSNLQATAGDQSLGLTWSPVSGAQSYNVYRGLFAGGQGQTAYRSGIAATSFADTGLTNGQTYYYKVTSASAGAESGLSSEVAGTPVATAPPPPPSPTTVPASPVMLGVTSLGKQLKLDWSLPAGTLTAVKVYRAEGTTGLVLINTLSPTTGYVDRSVTSQVTYSYAVSAVNSAGESAKSNVVSQRVK